MELTVIDYRQPVRVYPKGHFCRMLSAKIVVNNSLQKSIGMARIKFAEFQDMASCKSDLAIPDAEILPE